MFLRVYKVHSSKEKHACTDHSCVFWWREVLLRHWALPTPWLFSGFHLGHGEEIIAYPVLHFTCLCLRLCCFLNDTKQQHRNSKKMHSDFTQQPANFVLNLTMKISLTHTLISFKTHGSYNPRVKATSRTLSTWLYCVWKMSEDSDTHTHSLWKQLNKYFLLFISSHQHFLLSQSIVETYTTPF